MSFEMVEYLTDNLDISRQTGDEVVLKECLFCGRPQKMYVNIAKLRFHCFAASCNASGRLIALVMAIEDCDAIEASRVIKGMAKGTLPSKPLNHLEREFGKLIAGEGGPTESGARVEALKVPLPPDYEPCYDGSEWKVPVYLKERGVQNEDLQKWQVGFARRGRYAGRVIVPIRCDGMTSFVARDSTGEALQKYLNPGTAMMGHMLFGYDACPKGRLLVAVEGVFDAIKLWSIGIPAVAYFGSMPRPQQTRLMERLNPHTIVLMPDPDAVEAVCDYASSNCSKFDSMALALLREGDPASSTREQLMEALSRAVPIESRLDSIAIKLNIANHGR